MPPPASPAATGSTRPSGLPPRASVLILDDQRYDRHRLARLCSGLGIKTTITNADCLQAAAGALDSRRYDLIFVDYDLPDGTGFELLPQIRTCEKNCTAAVIMVSGFGLPDLPQAALSEGCTDYLAKEDLNPDTFGTAVTQALRQIKPRGPRLATTFDKAEVEAVLARFATQSTKDIKPMISRLMRQLRDLRDMPATPTPDTKARFEAADRTCLNLWSYLSELERHDPETRMINLLQDTPTPSPEKTRRKPPSPFSSRLQ